MSTVIGRFKRRQPKNIKSRRALRKMEAKVFENPKTVLFLRGANTSETVTDAMADLRTICKPHVKTLAKRNAFHPFEGQQHLEFLGFKNDASLFCFGSDNKKRPDNLVIGRQFEFQILDMMEFGIIAADRFSAGDSKGLNAASLGSKPMFVFEGSEFETDPFFIRTKNLLVDFFNGGTITELNVSGIDRAVFVSLRSDNGSDAVVAPSSDIRGASSSGDEKGNAILRLRHYGVVQTKSLVGQMKSVNNLELVDVGPNFDLAIRRVFFAPNSDFKRAVRVPREALAFTKNLHENIQTDGLGQLRGQLHVGSQDTKGLALRKFVAHRRDGSGEGQLTGSLGDMGLPQGETADDSEAAAAATAGARPTKRRRKEKGAGDTGYGSAAPEIDI
jgi:ribosome production factor 2